VAARSPLSSACIAFTGDDDVSFAEPWEAKAFAIILQMSAGGHFTWAEWVDCFSREVAAATEAAAAGKSAPTYYEQWLAAAEKILILKGLTSRDQLLAKRFSITSAGSAHLLK
jgi:nitrile hydratase accessory protein